MSLIVIVLGATELGYLFFMKRQFQKTVDLAALAGAQKIVPNYNCGTAQAAALGNAAINLPDFTPVVTCGNWNPVTNTADGRHFVGTTTNFNAVRVQLDQEATALLPGIFTGNRRIQVEAVGTIGTPYAAFSVGTTLARVAGDSTVGAFLKGIGVPISGSFAGYEGLANVKITPSGLLQRLGVEVPANISAGDLNNLLATTVGAKALIDVLNATVDLAGQSTLASANSSLVNAVQAQLGVSSLALALGSSASTGRGLFASIVTPDTNASSALTTEVSALSLITTAIGVATGNHAVQVNNLTANLGLATVSTQVHVIEPPSIAIGGVGATAYTAQVRSYTRIKASTAGIPLIGSLLKVSLDLPIVIDVVSGKGTLNQLCTAGLQDSDGSNRAKIDVEAAILKTCVGNVDEATVFSNSGVCESLSNKKLLSIGVAGSELIGLNTNINISPLPSNGSVILKQGMTQTVGNNLLLGTTVSDLTNALLASLLAGALNGESGQTYSAQDRTNIATDLWGTTPCAANTSAGQTCRINRTSAIQQQIDASGTGLTGFFGSLTTSTLSLLSSVLTVDVAGVINKVGALASSLVTAVGSVLGGVLNLVTGSPCTGGGLLGGNGSDSACIASIADSLQGSSGTGSSATPNAATSLVGLLLNVLKPVLDQLGTNVLTPLLQNTFGIYLGQTDVNLMSLQCGTGKLVY